ncbi:unnamed protein product [Prorocentrum cordatum]|uniref:Uncharacterized protein n=1 Tax=Prorocentrum cordatum TaxID=2364126 RepID=A0ABN9UEW7_9DINO|nr:unnamed protein product [Polarella glacialis]
MVAIDVVDVRTDMRLQRFDRTDERWGDWSLRFEAYTALLGFEDLMTEVALRRDPVLADALGDRAKAVSQRLWHLPITWCAVKLSRNNGLEAWRQLKIECESRTGDRWTAMLRFTLSPQDKLARDRESGINFFQSLTGVSDSVRVSVLLEHAPEPYREALRQAPEDVKLTFGAARSHIRGYYNQGRTFTRVPDTGGVVPMQVDAARGGPPMGKAGGTTSKAGKMDRSGGKAGKAQEGKDSKMKSKNRDGGKRARAAKASSPSIFDGECGYRGKWSHKRQDCRNKKADDAKKQQVAKIGGSILINSGSGDHMCRRKFVPEAPVKGAEKAPRRSDVQKRPLPAAGKLLRQGFRFNLRLEEGLYMAEGHRGVQLELARISLRLPIASAGPAEVRRCRGAAEQQAAATAPVLNADSSVGTLRTRLRELFVPINGAMAELWGKAPDAPRSLVMLGGAEQKAPLISNDFGFCETAGGAASPRAIASIKSFVQRLETGGCRVRADAEQATEAILGGVVNELAGKVAPELTPKRSSQSNSAEAAVKIVEGQTRVLKLDLEKRYGTRIAVAMPIWAWATRHAGWLRERYQSASVPGLRQSARSTSATWATRPTCWGEVSDEVEDPTEGAFDVDMQGEPDKKLTQEHLQSLLDHGAGEDILKSEANGMKHIAARWEKQWRWRPAQREWQRKVRSAPIYNRLVDFVALERGFEVMALDATGACYRAPQCEGAVVASPQESLDVLGAEGKGADIYWKLKKQLPGRRTAAPGWAEHRAGILAGEMHVARCEVAPQFFYNPNSEMRMGDLRMAGQRGALGRFREELELCVALSGGEIHERGATYEHLKRLGARFERGAVLRANPKCPDCALDTLGLGSSNTAYSPRVPVQKALVGSAPALPQQQAGVYRSCAGALLVCAQDRADCHCEVSLLGRMLSGPAVGAFAVLKRLVRYLLGARGAVNWLPKPSVGTHVELVVCGDSDWAGVAEYYAATAVAEDILNFKSLLEFMGFAVATAPHADASAARGVARREGVGKVRSLGARVLWPKQAIKRRLIDARAVGADDNNADLGTNILGHDRFVKLRALSGINADMGQVVASDEQSDEVDFDVGAVARPSQLQPLGGPAMITAAAALLQGCEGPPAEHNGYYYDAEVCASVDGLVASDHSSYLLMLVLWAPVAAAVGGYAGFRYAESRGAEWLLAPPEPNDEKDATPTDMTMILNVPASSVMQRPDQVRRPIGTHSQTSYKWKWGTPRFQSVPDYAHGAVPDVRMGNVKGPMF